MNTQRSTFTLVDLIGLVVVVFVLGTLASLLLPSVGGGVVSRRAMCLHNLKQLSMASLEHAARHDGFPGYRQKIGEQTFPWCMVVMPMLEQGDIYDTWVDPNTTRFNAPQVRIDVLICPSDPIKRSDRAHLSYIANAGMADDFNYNSANGGMPNVAAGAAPVTLAYLAKHDGAPHTLLLSENVQATYWHLPGWTDATMFWHRRQPPLAAQHINVGTDKRLSLITARPSSRHAGGVNVAFCDGHVRFFSEDIDYHVFAKLMTPNDAASDLPDSWQTYELRDANLDR